MKVKEQVDLEPDEYYLIQFKGRRVVGQYVVTRGNDQEYPTFKIGMLHSKPYLVSTQRVNVVGKMVLVK